jgi:hypothetical protein
MIFVNVRFFMYSMAYQRHILQHNYVKKGRTADERYSTKILLKRGPFCIFIERTPCFHIKKGCPDMRNIGCVIMSF